MYFIYTIDSFHLDVARHGDLALQWLLPIGEARRPRPTMIFTENETKFSVKVAQFVQFQRIAWLRRRLA